MTPRLTPFVMMVGLTLLASDIFAQSSVQTERIEASFVLAFGRAPSPAELADAVKMGGATVSDLVDLHRKALQSGATLQRATAIKAWKDAFGREPTDEEIASPLSGNLTYTELLKKHIEWLAEHPAEYERLMERGYRLVIRRGVYPGEIAYWKARDTLPFSLLVASIEEWGRRNAPGLMETTGIASVSVNSIYLKTVPLSPAVAAEARAALDLAVSGTPDMQSASGRNLVAAGGDNLVTNGRIHFTAAGGSNLVPANSRN